jgi:hypothetical protein
MVQTRPATFGVSEFRETAHWIELPKIKRGELNALRRWSKSFPTSGDFARSSPAASRFHQTSRPPRDVSGVNR